jgi:predicted nucleotidyltransferase
VSSVRPNFGPFASEADALNAVVARIASAIDPAAIWLFGSRARGDARPDSDFELLVVGKPGGDLGSDDYERVDRPLHGLGIGCDVVPCAAEDFEDGLSLNTSFVRWILEEGRKVYEVDLQ